MQSRCRPGGRVGPVRVDGDDVRVLEPGQGLRLARAGARDLHRHRPVGQLPLLGAEDPGERAPAQLLDQAEPGDRLARPRARESLECFGERSVEAWPEPTRPWISRTARNERRPRGTGVVLGRIGRLARLLAEAVLLVDQGHQRLAVELRIAVRDTTRPDPIPRLPAQRQVRPEQRQQRRPGRSCGSLGRKSSGSGRRRPLAQALSYCRTSRAAEGDEASSQVRPAMVRLIPRPGPTTSGRFPILNAPDCT